MSPLIKTSKTKLKLSCLVCVSESSYRWEKSLVGMPNCTKCQFDIMLLCSCSNWYLMCLDDGWNESTGNENSQLYKIFWHLSALCFGLWFPLTTFINPVFRCHNFSLKKHKKSHSSRWTYYEYLTTRYSSEEKVETNNRAKRRVIIGSAYSFTFSARYGDSPSSHFLDVHPWLHSLHTLLLS